MRAKVNSKLSKLLLILMVCTLMFNALSANVLAAEESFSDVPQDHWSYDYIEKLRGLEITSGVGDGQFGLGQTVTRAEFVTFLCKLMGWELVEEVENNFSDNSDSSEWFFPYVSTALKHGVINNEDGSFRPKEAITRREMAVMIVNSLGYNELATKLNSQNSSFNDVTEDTGFINMAKDFGFIQGIDEYNYNPNNTAKREEVAAILIRMYERINNKIDHKNAFYAIRSASQKDSISNFDSISFGWGKLEFDNGNLIVNNTSANENEYSLPEGYEDIINISGDKEKMLMLAVSNEDAANILNDVNLRANAVDLMADSISDFDGIVVDFEGLKGESLKNSLNELLNALRNKVGNKKIYVAVHPIGRETREYFDGYDYKTIGDIADKVILMAHDYNAKLLSDEEMANGVVDTPLTPIEDVYYALREITDPNTGVQDHNKILLQLSFITAQWKTQEGKVLHNRPYTPNYDALIKRMNTDVEMNYSSLYENPFIKFYDGNDGTNNIIWYEDSRSVEAKVNLAKLFDLKGISVWRLGIIPDGDSQIYMDVLSKIENY